MNSNATAGKTRAAREAVMRRLFPAGLPRLWCPPLTHFAAKGQIDAERIRRHLRFIAPQIKGILVPGSTGEGWEMTNADIQDLLAAVLDAVHGTDIRVLIGVLKTNVREALECLQTTLDFLARRSGMSSREKVLESCQVAGFTVCPPKGPDLSPASIERALAQILEQGLPTALYQLPQVTGNEMSPETVRSLASRYPNFYLFKDTSGRDQVAQSPGDLDGVFLVRGAEGGYAQWPRSAGGPYDGFLLSTANVFARELDTILRLIDQGRRADALALSERLDKIVQGCFEIVAGFPVGNAFANANKICDHLMAHGSAGVRREPPLLYSGARLPESFVAEAAELLHQNDLLPAQGYLA